MPARHADGCGSQRLEKIPHRRRREAHPLSLQVAERPDRLLHRVHLPGRMGEEDEDLYALVLGVEELLAQLRIVEGARPGIGAPDHVRQVDELGEGKPPRRPAVKEPRHVGAPRARQIEVLLRRPELRAGEALHHDLPVRALLERLGPADQPLRHRMLVAHVVRELQLDRLRLGRKRGQREDERGERAYGGAGRDAQVHDVSPFRFAAIISAGPGRAPANPIPARRPLRHRDRTARQEFMLHRTQTLTRRRIPGHNQTFCPTRHLHRP